MPGNRSARVALVCGIVGLATPLVSAIPLVVLAGRNGDLLPGFVVLTVGIIFGAIAVVFGVLGRGSAPEAPDRRRATIGIWLGASAILASVLLSILLVGAAVSTLEF